MKEKTTLMIAHRISTIKVVYCKNDRNQILYMYFREER